jgi:hypothetical protein
MPRPTPSYSRPVGPAAPSTADAESTLRFGPLNLALLAAGLAAVVVGFMLTGGGSTVVAPLLLVLGFAVLVPLGIIL